MKSFYHFRAAFKLAFLIVFLSFGQLILGQAPQSTIQCGFELLQEEGGRLASEQEQLNQFESKVRTYLNEHQNDAALRPSSACWPGQQTYRIPTVIHLVHYTGSVLGTGANLTDAAVTTIIGEINDRFTHASALNFTNPNSGTDTGIQLVLATRTPAGIPTNGIVRHMDDVNAENVYGTDNTQNAYNWNTNDYFNIYVVETICDAGSCPNPNGVAGYANYPTSHGNLDDGAVFRAASFWSGLVAHEAGHYFGLRHTFQGGCVNNDCTADGDLVCDTPPKTNAGYGGGTCVNPPNGCAADDDDLSLNNPFRPLANGGLGDIVDGLENYMDYTAGCWEAYTIGQGARMRASIETGRTSLLNSNGAVPFSANDASVTALVQPTDAICTSPFTPEITLTNVGTAMLTTCQVQLDLDGANVQTFAWNGNLAPGASLNVILNPVATVPGTHTLLATSNLPNGLADGYNPNNGTCIEFDYNNPLTIFPYSEGFEGAIFPPSNLSIYNPDGGNAAWNRNPAVGGFGGSVASIFFDNFNNNVVGTVDEFRTESFDFTSQTNISLNFDVAYARYGGGNFDGLEVYYSLDCGLNWVQVFNKAGSVLATAPDITAAFIPTPAQWRSETINLSALGLDNQTSVRFAFRNIPGFGNNLYIDNLNLLTASLLDQNDLILVGNPVATGIALNWEQETKYELLDFEIFRLEEGSLRPLGTVEVGQGDLFIDQNPLQGMNVYQLKANSANQESRFSNLVEVNWNAKLDLKVWPNPFSGDFFISGIATEGQVQYRIYDLRGKLILENEKPMNGETLKIEAENLRPGCYFLQLKGLDFSQHIRIVKQ